MDSNQTPTTPVMREVTRLCEILNCLLPLVVWVLCMTGARARTGPISWVLVAASGFAGGYGLRSVANYLFKSKRG